ncbi:hypothetical protein CLOSYM_01381, partial [[Clostridium] symbiosum ATCC 14940]
ILFSFQGSLLLNAVVCSQQQLLYLTIIVFVCQQLFFISFFETAARFQQLEYHIITFIRCQHLF